MPYPSPGGAAFRPTRDSSLEVAPGAPDDLRPHTCSTRTRTTRLLRFVSSRTTCIHGGSRSPVRAQHALLGRSIFVSPRPAGMAGDPLYTLPPALPNRRKRVGVDMSDDHEQLGLFGHTPSAPSLTEGQKRDRALDILRAHRGTLIEAAFAVAVRIAHDRGHVSSTDVLAVLDSDPKWRAAVQAADRRFMGSVFRRKCWARIGWEETGSHGRPVAVWQYVAPFHVTS